MTDSPSSTATTALCPFCKKPPGQKVGPPAMARCITPECEGSKLGAVTLAEWNAARPVDAAQAEPERLPTHGDLLAEINKAAHAAGTNAWVRDVLKQAHRAIRMNAPIAAPQPASNAYGSQQPRLAEWLTDVITMLDAPDAYNREYIAAVCRSILSSVTSTDRNWTEDAPHENGNYECTCVECGHSFIGHKRRVLCKLCSNLLTPSVTSTDRVGGDGKA